MRFVLPSILSLALAGCGGETIVNCEFTLNDVSICEQASLSADACASERGGEPSRAEQGDEAITCADLGYATACPDACLSAGGEVVCGSDLYFAASEEDCAAAFPAG